MSKIFVITEFYYPQQHSSGYFITEIAEYLGKKSPVVVICASEVNKLTYELRNDINIYRIPDPKLNKNNLFQRCIKLYKIARDISKVGENLIQPEDKVLCLTNPAFSIIFLSKLKKRIGFGFNILVHDVFPENLIGANIFRFKGLIYWYLSKVFNNAYGLADKIIVIGSDMKEIYVNKLKAFKGEIIQIPIWGDSDNIYPSSTAGKKILSKLNCHSKLVFQFSGNIGRAQNIKRILSVSKELKDEDLCFLFFGEGAFKKLVQKCSLDNPKVFYGGIYKREDSNAYLNACNIAIVSLSMRMKGLGVPSKTYDIMAAGKPILYIGPTNSEIASLIIKEKIGWVINSESTKIIVAMIKQISQLDVKLIEDMGKRARETLLSKYTKQIVLDEYERILNG
jgi:glycosyltransferase involved in cell wall biosynthesis